MLYGRSKLLVLVVARLYVVAEVVAAYDGLVVAIDLA